MLVKLGVLPVFRGVFPIFLGVPSFIVTIAGMIYHDIKKVADESKLSVKEIMREMKKLKITLNGNKWVVENKIKSVRDVAAKVGFDIPKYLPDKTVST